MGDLINASSPVSEASSTTSSMYFTPQQETGGPAVLYRTGEHCIASLEDATEAIDKKLQDLETLKERLNINGLQVGNSGVTHSLLAVAVFSEINGFTFGDSPLATAVADAQALLRDFSTYESLYQTRLQSLEEKRETNNADIRQIEEDIDYHNDEARHAKREMNETSAKVRDAWIYDNPSARVDQLRERHDRLKNEVDNHKLQIDTLEEKLELSRGRNIDIDYDAAELSEEHSVMAERRDKVLGRY